MSEESSTEQYEIESESEFPSLSIALEEARRNYDTEQSRKSNIEVKIGTIIAVDALVISIVSVFGTMYIPTRLAILIPVVIAIGFALQAFSSREYLKPGPPVDELFGAARNDIMNTQKNFIQNYRQAIKHNAQRNSDRMKTLKKCFWLTVFSVFLLLLSPSLDGVLRALVASIS